MQSFNLRSVYTFTQIHVADSSPRFPLNVHRGLNQPAFILSVLQEVELDLLNSLYVDADKMNYIESKTAAEGDSQR